MQFKDFEVQVLVDGAVLPEYDVQYDEDRKIATCWIPSMAGKPFSVVAKPLKRRNHPVCNHLYADGTCLDGYALPAGTTTKATWDSKRTSLTTVCPLLFADIELTDDDAYLNTGGEDLGTLTLQVSQGKLSAVPHEYEHDAAYELVDKKVHERSKKAMKHKISLGDEVKQPATQYQDFEIASVICRFIFKYRSLNILRADGIAPPASPSPPPTTKGKRKASEAIDDDNDNKDRISKQPDGPPPLSTELDEDEIQLKRLLEQVHSVKSRISAKNGVKTTSKKAKKVKKEHRPVFLSGEVIDLT